MQEIVTLPAEWLQDLNEEDRARVVAEVEKVNVQVVGYDPYEDERDA